MAQPDVLLANLAAANHGVFNREQARSVGFSEEQIKRRLRVQTWLIVHECAYRFAAAPVTWKGDLLAGCWAGGVRARGSHRSAGALWGLPGGRTDLVEITCPRWRRARHPGLIVHETKRFDECDITTVQGIPTTTPECTLLNLGAVCRPSTVELAFEDGLRRELFTVGSLRQTLERLGRKGRNGAGVLRGLLDERDPSAAPTASTMETRVIQMLRRNGLPAPVRQFEIFDGNRFVARVDFAYPDWKIALEYESYEHHTGRLALNRDNPRRNALLALRWKPIGITTEDVRTGGALVCTRILDAMRRPA